MYIIVIGWLYITVLMAATETSITAGILSLVFYGLLPVGLFLWVFGTPSRRRAQIAAARRRLPEQSTEEVVCEVVREEDRANAKQDQ